MLRFSRRPAALVGVTLLAAAALAVGAPSGCASGATTCHFNSDCPFGYCMNGACQQSCVDSARDCPPGYTCDQNAQCVPPGSGGSASSASGTGGSGPTASAGTGGAGSGASSSTGTATSSATSSVTSTSSTSGPSTTSTSSTSGPSTSSSTSGGTMNEHELDPCTSDGDCATPLVCRPMFPGGTQRCTRTCSSTGGCMAGTVCVSTSSEGMYCAGDDTGRQCGAATDCNFGCLSPPTPAYCTVPCQTGADCPNGYGCMPVGTNNTRVCVKAELPCGSGADCTYACDTSLLVSGCTTKCTSAADCPQRAAGFAPWTCNASTGACRRPADVYGPLQNGATPAQYACNGQGATVNVCNDAQHIDFTAFDIPNPPAVSCSATTTTAGISTDSCVDSCRYQGWCPYGFACVAVGSVGSSRVGLCLPTGTGEVGSPCAHDADCVFGYCPSALGKCSRDCTYDGVCPTGTSCVAAGTPPVEGLPFRRCQ